MDWSFSEAATFDRCPRQWYFKYHLANANAKRVPLRRETYLLSKLDSLWTWRGKVVDYVISRYVVPELENHHVVGSTECLKHARRIFDRQLAFGLRHGLRDPSLVVSSLGEGFAAFHAVEYGPGISEREIAQAWSEVEQALSNLLALRELLAVLQKAERLLTQRSLRFMLDLPVHGPVTVKATPDLLAFYDDLPPLIVDWKVRVLAAPDYRTQLTLYALALAHCRPHKDFPAGLSRYAPQDLRLLEVQLLQSALRTYKLAEEDVADAEGHIFHSVSQMKRVLDGKGTDELSAEDFPTARYPRICEGCSFRAICWEGPRWREPSQTSFPF